MQFELGMTKDELTGAKHRMAQTVSTHSSPTDFLRQHSDMLDSLVRKAFRHAQSQVSSPSVCLMAVGGYGRAEMAPHSDIDLLLLYSAPKKEDLPPLVEKILYPLWDLGLDVSCSSRSITECLKMAQSDLHTKTGLIDGRYLDGEYEFFRNLYDLFLGKILHRKVRNFAEALTMDLSLRHQKYEDPNYALEPNIKEGEGGLRDFQAGRWIIRAKYKTDRWDSILFPDHSRSLEKGLQFLWAVRNQLHLLSGRKQDDLTFEFQEKIASTLGFPPGTKGIEEMMREYHLATQRISTFVDDILERALYEPCLLKKAFSFLQRKKIDENFGTAYGELYLFDPVTFKRDPPRLMTLFHHCQTYQIKMDFRTEEAVMESLPFIDDRFRTSREVNETFLSILRKGDRAADLLRKMHELGLLSRYIPEFSEVEGKVHYDLYHVHPVDSHSILAVEELEKLQRGQYEREVPLLTSLIRELENPGILFLTALLHDIGKGREGNHSLLGAEWVERIGTRMGLTSEEKEPLVFLVGHHLSMIETAFRRNLQEEQVITHFAQKVKNLNQLKMLYLLTFADIRAVGPEAWTDWKNTLLMELFLKTAHFFERGAVAEPFLMRDELVQKLQSTLSPEIISEYTDRLPDRYLSSYSSAEIA
ncbi:MAG TPA: [protein-PII] uridylyltransferase, partial [Thermodesulfobacteriota bacterium]|nr:[protein-PII] uridylyltransferase [Thermodesulfobacteriota bacterium]